jgi:Acyl-CoA reductase (LuxC)
MRRLPPSDPLETARSLAAVLGAWRLRDFAPRRATIAAVAAAWGYSEPLLDASLDALLAPFIAESLASFAESVTNRRDTSDKVGEVVGMVMPGNLPGAGLHEVVLSLLSGMGVILKTSEAEPFFFAGLSRTLRNFDVTLADRLAVFNWGRDRKDLTAATRTYCSWLVAFGEDDTLQHLREDAQFDAISLTPVDGQAGKLKAGFGRRFSGAYVGEDAATNQVASSRSAITDALALDLSLFEQAGCLSPHHVFVEDRAWPRRVQPHVASKGGPSTGCAHELAAALADSLDRMMASLPPPGRVALETAAALRRVRESARWRALGGEPVTLWEGERLGWTVIYDEAAAFSPSPGFRTVTVSPVGSVDDLRRRLAKVDGRLEAFAVAGSHLNEVKRCLDEQGVSYLCSPGMMQSPPLSWLHGGGQFHRALAARRRVGDE